jgi:hypothetical protein
VRNTLTWQVLRVVGLGVSALVLYVLLTWPTRARLARDHYKMWREERQLAKERKHAAATIAKVHAGRSASDPDDE